MSDARSLVLWFPDWPIRAALDAPPPHPAVAIMHGNTVVACSAAARAQGVRRGQRRRVAQSRAPDLRLIRAHPPRDERLFLPVLRLLEEHAPGVALLRPGLVALRARGVSRYYGGEAAAAEHLITYLDQQGYPDTRAGVADGLFTAEQASRLGTPVHVVAPGEARAFLAPLPLSVLNDDAVITLLPRLGIHTLADFAALAEHEVRDRWGERGARLHALASGADSRTPQPTPIDPEWSQSIRFEAPLLQADQIAFAIRQTADAVIDALATASLVCTEITITFLDDNGASNARTWMHPTCFEASDLVDRVRWQLEALATPNAEATDHDPPGIAEVHLTPHRVDASAHHQPGLFGQGTDDRLHHALSRVQALIGHRGVVTPQVSGGRRLAERQVLHPWGDRTTPTRDARLPWPGALPPPYPAEVFTPPYPAQVTSAAGTVPGVDDRGILSDPPARIDGAAVIAWAGPWPLRERTWDRDHRRLAHRFQLVDDAQNAWLVLCEDTTWWVEGRYR